MSGKGGKTKTQNQLWLARKRRGLGQKQVGYLINTGVDQISRYERGKRIPGLEIVLALEIVYGVPARMLFRDLYQEILLKIQDRAAGQEALSAIYGEILSGAGEQSIREFCAYEEMLKAPSLSEVDRDTLRSHITRLAKKLAYL